MRRLGVALACAAACIATAVVAIAGPAAAHVSIDPPTAQKGSFTTLAFQVPNEKSNVSTNQVQVKFPDDHPIADASVQAVPGWSVKVAKKKLATPVKTDEGDTLTEAVDTVTWTANDKKGFGDGQFQQFLVSLALPADAESLAFPTIQTYSDGSAVDWVQETPPGGPEPDNPRPVLQLKSADAAPTAASSTGAAGTAAAAKNVATQSDVDNAKTISIVALVVGALGLLVGIAGFVWGRRRSAA